jgi:hypothetical protein
LVLRFGHAAFKQGELGLRFSQALLRIFQARARRLIDRVESAETHRDLGAQLAPRVAPIEPDGDHRRGKQRQHQREQPPACPRRITRRRRGRRGGGFVHRVSHGDGN